MKPHYSNTNNPIDFPKNIEVKIMEMEKSLVDRVITQIELDIRDDNLTALEELLKHLPEDVLQAYLPEVNIEPEFDEFDGSPDEAQEWHDFDPDC